jgi:hypothetical protein
MTQPDSNPCTKLTAITGTWSDLERHARYVYENADEQSSEWMLSEAVLVLLNLDRESRRPDSNQRSSRAVESARAFPSPGDIPTGAGGADTSGEASRAAYSVTRTDSYQRSRRQA